MKKSLLLLIPLILSLGACTNPKTPDTPDIPDTPDTPDWGETATYTISFRGDKSRTGWSGGSQISNPTFKNALEELVNNQTNNSLIALDGDKCAAQPVGENDTTLTIGSGSSEGYVYFTFSLDIVEIDATIQNYHKVYNGGFSLDSEAEVTMCSYSPAGSGTVIEGKEVNLLVTDTTAIPDERQESLELKEKANTIAFFNNDAQHRTFIHSLTITYVVE